MIESMACGTPVVATRFGAVPEVIEHGTSGLIVDAVSDMVSAIEALSKFGGTVLKTSLSKEAEAELQKELHGEEAAA